MTKRAATILFLFAVATVILFALFSALYRVESPVFTRNEPTVSLSASAIIPTENRLYEYVEVVGGCGPYYSGECLHVHSGPGESYPVVTDLRNGIVLAVDETVAANDGSLWHKIIFNEWLRYPNRIATPLYVPSNGTRFFADTGNHELTSLEGIFPASSKRIIVSRTKQKLYAYDGNTLFMEQTVSTGLELTPTPRGEFIIYRKTPTRYMQGPLPGISDQYYDLPGVPWNLYFTKEGGVIHGAYWHDKFGQRWSHGCVNLPLDAAQKLYEWAEVGTRVIVED